MQAASATPMYTKRSDTSPDHSPNPRSRAGRRDRGRGSRRHHAKDRRFVVAFVFFSRTERAAAGQIERRLISLIFAGRNRIIMIRRKLPLTVIAVRVSLSHSANEDSLRAWLGC